jgi:hypothetical protein
VNLKVPITGTIASDAGPLTVKGTIHLVIHPLDPIQPQDPVRVQANLIQVSASNTAVSCKATGAQKFTLATTQPHRSSGSTRWTHLPRRPDPA